MCYIQMNYRANFYTERIVCNRDLQQRSQRAALTVKIPFVLLFESAYIRYTAACRAECATSNFEARIFISVAWHIKDCITDLCIIYIADSETLAISKIKKNKKMKKDATVISEICNPEIIISQFTAA